jgi:hypothetical protein
VNQGGNQNQERYNNQVNNTDRPKTHHKKQYGGNNYNNQKKFNNGPYDNNFMKNPNQHFVNKFDNTNAFAQQMGGVYQYGNMTPNQYMYPQMQNEAMQQQYSMNYPNQMQNMNMAPNQELEQGTEQDTTSGDSLDKVILDSL